MGKNDYLIKEKESWEIMAQDTAYLKIPDFQSSEFLKLLERSGMLDPSCDVLDIGCGAAVYSIAMKDRIHSALCIDFSDCMLQNARRLIEEHQASNIYLKSSSWQELNLDEENLREKFDLVFSHTTPAIASGEDLQKMMDASRKFCVVSLFARVHQPIMDKIKSELGIRPDTENRELQRIDRIEQSVTMIFDYLYRNGYYPMVHYEDSPYVFRQKTKTAVEYYTKDAEKIKKLEASDKEKIKKILLDASEDGIVTEDMHPCIVTFYWDKRRNCRK